MSDFDDALRDLANDGFFVARNFSCCSIHGIEQLIQEEALRKEDPYVFTSHQDEVLWRQTGELWLTWGGEDQGEEIADALRRWQIDFDWDGKPTSRFLIHIPAWPDPLEEREEDV